MSTSRDPLDEQAVVNPAVVFEVTSPSSEAYDRGEKLRHYQHVPSLQEIVVVSHAGRRVDVWRRQGDGGWTPKAFGPGDVVQLASIDCDLAVDAIDLDPLADD